MESCPLVIYDHPPDRVINVSYNESEFERNQTRNMYLTAIRVWIAPILKHSTQMFIVMQFGHLLLP